MRYYEKDDTHHKKGMEYAEPGIANMEIFFAGAERNDNLMQYTGLKDCNGKEIYEGDIICYKKDEFQNNQPNYQVYYAIDEGNYPAYDIKPETEGINCNGLQFLIENYQIEVIGNIFENQELLR